LSRRQRIATHLIVVVFGGAQFLKKSLQQRKAQNELTNDGCSYEKCALQLPSNAAEPRKLNCAAVSDFWKSTCCQVICSLALSFDKIEPCQRWDRPAVRCQLYEHVLFVCEIVQVVTASVCE
jgi:hypothetical protein